MDSNRISDALFLLSRENYWDAVKIVYDVLVNKTFVYATSNKLHKQFELEEKGKEMLCLMYDFLVAENVLNVAAVISEIRLLTIYFNNFSREALAAKEKNNKIKVLTMNLIGLLNFLEKKNGAEYIFGMINSELKREIQNNLTEEIFESTSPYFDLLLLSQEKFQRNFWEDLEESFNPKKIPISIFSDDEYDKLISYKEIIDKHQLILNRELRIQIEDIWGTHLNSEEIAAKVLSQYHLLNLYEEFDNFRKSDKSSGKYDKNIYIKEKEGGFHKNVYPYLCGTKNYDLVFSEFVSGNQRYDILLYQAGISLSAIVELKVNMLSKPDENIQQILNYLDEVEDKPYHYMEQPTVGVLLIYYIGAKLLSQIKLIEKVKEFEPLTQISNNFYLLKPNDERITPILIGLLNGKE